MAMNMPLQRGLMSNITFIITSPYYDSGIKSLGSKSIYPIRKNTILEKQHKAIKQFCAKNQYEILLINSIDHNKTAKFIESKRLNLEYIYLNNDNINHAGSFLRGLELAKYETIVTIDNGLIVSQEAIKTIIEKNCDADINIGCVGNKHKQSQDLEIGCVTNGSVVNNIFFGLDNKFMGITRINQKTKQFILNEFNFAQDRNKFLFEIINQCIAKELICKKTEIKSKDSHLIFNKKTLQQYTGGEE